jgi:hypothetical protein
MARACQLVLWAAMTVGTGCASTPRYLHNRGADLVDIVQLHAVASIGADAKLEVTGSSVSVAGPMTATPSASRTAGWAPGASASTTSACRASE